MKYYFSCANGGGDSTDDIYSFKIDTTDQHDNNILKALNDFFDKVINENYEPSFSEFKDIYGIISELTDPVDLEDYDFDQSYYDYFNNEGGFIISRHNLETNNIDYINFSNYQQSDKDSIKFDDVEDKEILQKINEFKSLFPKISFSEINISYDESVDVIGKTEYDDNKLDVNIHIIPYNNSEISISLNNMGLTDYSSSYLIISHLIDKKDFDETIKNVKDYIKNIISIFNSYLDEVQTVAYDCDNYSTYAERYSFSENCLYYSYSYYDVEYTGSKRQKFINKKDN